MSESKGDVTQYRLSDLERRMSRVENAIIGMILVFATAAIVTIMRASGLSP